ncbi:15541_t:CDS:2 [Dentiscutata heterogama]|uniref:15541_t:CDS:1 n=1 Tax=Dentiscutata heterogama TaxID=1316150 RepID=A0ACA9K027_9GLOM|nr:15541_t:CDS:2 [Dentiscutata heterogama]
MQVYSQKKDLYLTIQNIKAQLPKEKILKIAKEQKNKSYQLINENTEMRAILNQILFRLNQLED